MHIKKLNFSDSTARVFFVGDIHGRYQLLQEQLKKVGFSPENGDTLISVGDIIDGGTENDEMLAMVELPWFEFTLGNHEFLMKQATKGLTEAKYNAVSSFLIDNNGMGMLGALKQDSISDDDYDTLTEYLTTDEINWIGNGGGWFYNVFESKPFSLRLKQAQIISSSIPVGIEVNHPSGLIGVLHAGIKNNKWRSVGKIAKSRPMQLMWTRKNLKSFYRDDKSAYEAGYVDGVDALVVGHSTIDRLSLIHI